MVADEARARIVSGGQNVAKQEPIDAYDKALVQLAELFGTRSEGFLREKSTASILDIPFKDWPAVGLIRARGTYHDAKETMVASAQEGSTYSRALLETLDTVREHYSAAHIASIPKSIDGTAPVVAAPSSARTVNRSMTDLGYATLGVMTVGSIAAGASRLPLLRERLAALREVTMGPQYYPVVIGVGLLLANLRDSEPFLLASKAWKSVANSAHDSAIEIQKQIDATMTEGWKGTAAMSFREHIDRRFVPALLRYHEHANAMAHLGTAGAEVLDKSYDMAVRLVTGAILAFAAYKFLTPLFPQSQILTAFAAGVFLGAVWHLCEILHKQYDTFAELSGHVAEQAELVRKSFLSDGLFDHGNYSGWASIKPEKGTVWVPRAGEQWTPEEWERQWEPAQRKA
jgi:hypothetical protein